MMGAIHFADMLRLLDQAYQHRSLVDIHAWEGGTGEMLHYKIEIDRKSVV